MRGFISFPKYTMSSPKSASEKQLGHAMVNREDSIERTKPLKAEPGWCQCHECEVLLATIKASGQRRSLNNLEHGSSRSLFCRRPTPPRNVWFVNLDFEVMIEPHARTFVFSIWKKRNPIPWSKSLASKPSQCITKKRTLNCLSTQNPWLLFKSSHFRRLSVVLLVRIGGARTEWWLLLLACPGHFFGA